MTCDVGRRERFFRVFVLADGVLQVNEETMGMETGIFIDAAVSGLQRLFTFQQIYEACLADSSHDYVQRRSGKPIFA